MAFSTARIKPIAAPLDPTAPPSAPVPRLELVMGENGKSANAARRVD